jgi:2-keto-3-deoxy-L-fuconate dehydrogenase
VPREFDGLVAAVTGGGSGIGLATVRLLAARGARVAALDLDPSAAAEPVAGSERSLPVVTDVTDEASVAAAVAAVVGRWGRLDVLVNNAGVGAQGTVEDNPYEEWRRVLEVNLLGVVRTTRAALPHLRRSPHAAIVNTCSIAATAGLVDRALYSASKGALRARQPTGRLVSAEEVAAAIAHLASPLAASTTGTALAVDGGMQGLRLRPPGSDEGPAGSGFGSSPTEGARDASVEEGAR